MKTCEKGRSMIEMLGVLAIVGVLSVGGIKGYSKAMAKIKSERVTSQINELVLNIRTLFFSAGNYRNISPQLLISVNAVPADMFDPNNRGSNAEIKNALGGDVILFTSHKGDVSPPPPGVTIVLKLVKLIQITLISF